MLTMTLDFNYASFDIDYLAMICHHSEKRYFATTYIYGSNNTKEERFDDNREPKDIWDILKNHDNWLQKWNFFFNTDLISRLDYNKKESQIIFYLTNATKTTIGKVSEENYTALRHDIERVKSRYLCPPVAVKTKNNKPA